MIPKQKGREDKTTEKFGGKLFKKGAERFLRKGPGKLPGKLLSLAFP